MLLIVRRMARSRACVPSLTIAAFKHARDVAFARTPFAAHGRKMIERCGGLV